MEWRKKILIICVQSDYYVEIKIYSFDLKARNLLKKKIICFIHRKTNIELIECVCGKKIALKWIGSRTCQQWKKEFWNLYFVNEFCVQLHELNTAFAPEWINDSRVSLEVDKKKKPLRLFIDSIGQRKAVAN